MLVDRSIDDRVVLQPEDELEQHLLEVIFVFSENLGVFSFYTLNVEEYPDLDHELHLNARLNPRGDRVDPEPGARAVVVTREDDSGVYHGDRN